MLLKRGLEMPKDKMNHSQSRTQKHPIPFKDAGHFSGFTQDSAADAKKQNMVLREGQEKTTPMVSQYKRIGGKRRAD